VSQDQSAACASGSAALEFGYSFDISKINHVHSNTTDDQQANDSCFDNQLYSLFKVANGEDISKATAPGMFDLKVRTRTPCLLPLLSRDAPHWKLILPAIRAKPNTRHGKRKSMPAPLPLMRSPATSPWSRSSRKSTATMQTRSPRLSDRAR
jgi:hypothetical protein